ncbi:hypothetical protein Ancab_003064 [Ancistrocladus abbreviatus]
MAPSRMLLAPSISPPAADSPYPDSMIILMALLCAIVCIVGLMAVARCAILSRCCRGRSTSVDDTNPRLPEGLKKKTIESLIPQLTYTLSLSSTTEGDSSVQKVAGAVERDQCAICLSEYVDGDEIRVLPNCSHVFHVGCIDTWLGAHASCPSCRQILFIAKCQKCSSSIPSPAPEPNFLP